MGVVVEAAYQAGIELDTATPAAVEPVLHLAKNVPARLVQVFGEFWRVGIDRLVALILAVEDAQGIALGRRWLSSESLAVCAEK